MPIPKYDGTPEKEWISSCMHEIGNEYDTEQALAICYKQMDMSAIQDAAGGGVNMESLPEVKEGEGRTEYVLRCIPSIYHEGGQYDQRVAASMCSDYYESKSKKENMSKSRFSINF